MIDHAVNLLAKSTRWRGDARAPRGPARTYFLLACADDLAKVTESDEANNCVASPTAAVMVTRPDLAETAVSAPPVTKQRGTTFTVTDTAQNIGAVA